MIFSHSIKNSVAIVTVKGYINHTNAVEFESYVSSLIKEGKNILIDCTDVQFISSTGLGALWYVQRLASTMGKVIALCNCGKELSSVIALIKLPIPMYSSIEEALSYIHHGVYREHSTNESVEHTQSVHASSIVTEDESSLTKRDSEQVYFVNPLIVECPQCLTMVKVKKSGKFKCPECELYFFVDGDGTVQFNV